MNLRVVILAAGKGKRMGPSEIPKVLHRVLDKPMVGHVIDAVVESGVDAKPVVVVGYMAEKVQAYCEDRCEYAMQTELKGTGDAVMRARPLLEGGPEHVLVLNGDQPLTSAASIRKVVDMHLATGATLTIGTVTVPDFQNMWAAFVDFGRIVRDAQGNVARIVEAKDATPEELQIRELNPSLYCFKAEWLWKNLESLTTANAQGEYYVTDLLAKAIASGENVVPVSVPADEALGINTPEQLAVAERHLSTRK